MFLTLNNGTIGNPPALDTSQVYVGQLTNPAIDYTWLVGGPLAGGLSNSFDPTGAVFPSLWLDTIWVFRVFPETELGDLQRFNADQVVVPYGNLYQDVVDPLVVFNAHRVLVNFTAFSKTGNEEGIVITEFVVDPPVAPPNPPVPAVPPTAIGPDIPAPPGFTIKLVALITYDVNLSTVMLRLCWTVDAGNLSSVCFTLDGARAYLFAQLPDWKENPPKLLNIYKTDTFQSDYRREARTTPFQDNETMWSWLTQHKLTYGDEFSRFWNRLIRMKHRRGAIPFYSESMIGTIDAAGLTQIPITNIVKTDLLFYTSGEVCRLDDRDPSYFEVRAFNGWIGNDLSVTKPWDRAIPPAVQTFFFILYVSLTKAKRVSKNDEYQVIDLGWRSQQ